LAAAHGMHLKQFDIGTTFLNSDLLEEIYMIQPPGFIISEQANHICLLQQSLYGLRQSARQWNQKFDSFFKQWELMSCHADSCVYQNKGSLHTLLGIYVDDGIIASTKPNFIEDILIYLESNFKVVRGEMDYFVGFQIERDHCNGSIFIHQTRYIDNIIKRFGLENAHNVTTPIDLHTKLSNRVDAADSYVIVPYKEAVGCAMYATLLTRLGICYATSLVAKFQPKPKQSH
jgi:hypothetical protein